MSGKRETAVYLRGKQVQEPAVRVLAYLECHDGTVSHYDLGGFDRGAVSAELIRATRRPWMGSRISRVEERWFIEHSADARWSGVPAGAQLAAADPLVADGLYDAAERLWLHFLKPHHRGVGWGKTSKVLHLMRPALYPILDTRLQHFYRDAAAQAASALRARRSNLSHRRLFWAAIREDLLASAGGLQAVRDELDLDKTWISHDGHTLSDVRLLDMLAWSGGN